MSRVMPFDAPLSIDAVRGQLSSLVQFAGPSDFAELHQLLARIRYTTKSLARKQRQAEGAKGLVNAAVKLVQSVEAGGILDVDGKLGQTFESAAGNLAHNIAHFVAKRACIDEDGRLSSSQRAHLHSCYEAVLTEWALLRESIMELHESIIDYDRKAPRPTYELDDGALTEEQYKWLRSRSPQGRGTVTSSLID